MVKPLLPDTVPHEGGLATDPIGGPVPEDNLPGHHPQQDQDKPSGKDFVAKMHALAQEDAYEAPSTDDEVLDLTQIDADEVHDGKEPDEDQSQRGEQLAHLAGKPFALAGKALQAVRDRLPGD